MRQVPLRFLCAFVLAAAAALPASAQRFVRPGAYVPPGAGPAFPNPNPAPSPAKIAALPSFPESISLPVRPELSLGALRGDIAPRKTAQGLSPVSPSQALLPLGARRGHQPQYSALGGVREGLLAPGAGAVERLSDRLSPLRIAATNSGPGADTGSFLHRFFFGAAPDASGSGAVPATEIKFIRNDGGVLLEAYGRAARYYLEAKRLWKKLDRRFGGPADLSSTMDVMADSEEETLVKMKALLLLAGGRPILETNIHIPGSRDWFDGIVQDPDGNRIAIQTLRVFFHRTQNPRSEIEEGKRRLLHALLDASYFFQPKGRVEETVEPVDRVILALDTRGYPELKRFAQQNILEIFGEHNRRFEFVFLDDTPGFRVPPDRVSAELNALARHPGHGYLLRRIQEGVLYSRYVGLLLELRTIEYLVDNGYEILHTGIELFGKNGLYITELDVVARKDGQISIWESKSFRQRISAKSILKYDIHRKLRTYRDYDTDIRQAIGGKFDVFFALDVGWWKKIIPKLLTQQAALGNEYQRPVSFVFLESYPNENLLFPRPARLTQAGEQNRRERNYRTPAFDENRRDDTHAAALALLSRAWEENDGTPALRASEKTRERKFKDRSDRRTRREGRRFGYRR
ncbi:MAG: hypothetical protein HY551_04250 [Elusimicrobia bacterium]|nr:hypothetical protein [Elusimicrobiota bacterium]